MLYPWIDHSSSRERRGRCTGIIIIRMVLIGQYVIHYTQHTLLIAAWHHHEWSLYCHPCTRSSFQRINTTPSYKTINSITRLYVYTWNNSVVIILWEQRDTDMTTNSTRRLTIHHDRPICHPIIIVSLYLPTPSYITINNRSKGRRREAKSNNNCCTALVVQPYSI